ncbi:Crp/Fnr family transcriptional regulator [Chryseobacterium sp. ISL-6]|uniref:Crp/Fnr family transcriptional regulator n=1 Tax=Chryseobacterium sp. ISL-6 TaxID=2819143 RepID=UPI001BEC63E5|nr:Crp/Fnr family transcriptional regulator [Chryseobacterium sp. ISL-6]MBT2620074.1 Crp/Fnr family transcriptional regulator [Chryseobacterium sp. ISL-6]
MVPIKIKKKHYFLKEGQINEYAGFVVKGALRLFSMDENGTDHILQFYIEDWWAVNMKSYMSRKPSDFFIEANENSELLAVPRDKFEVILEIPAFKEMFWYINQNHHIATQRRRDHAIHLSALKRYENFSLLYPQLVQRFPTSQIASYLGITRETLTRVRKGLSN